MIKKELTTLGERITQLRIAKQLKQSELAYEAGISERTLQRIEAGEVVKSDGLLKVIAQLGKLEGMLNAIDTPGLSPFELAKKPNSKAAPKRVRRTKNKATTGASTTAKIIWPEDQA